MASPIEVYYSYAHEDEPLLKQLDKHLSILKRQGVISGWSDRIISPGTEWEREIDKHLTTAQIILLLISPDFMASEYCYGVEMKHAMERHERGEVAVIPIILRPVYFQGAPFGKLQALPTDAKPVKSKSWIDQDEAFFNVAEGIRKVAGRFTRRTITTSRDKPKGSALLEAFYVKHRCPACMKAFYPGDCEIVSSVIPGKVLKYPSAGWGRHFERIKPAPLTSREFSDELACRKCPNCGFLLPFNIEQEKSFNTALGARGDIIERDQG